ncbi:MAG: hypothetical protein OEM93_18860, partial [Rhodospirillales bacterium]|nr:hypothetical protein [Rhodospirillales bacterium]
MERFQEIVWLVCVRRALRKEFGRDPSPEELAQRSRAPVEQLRRLLDIIANLQSFGFDFDRMDDADLTELLEGRDPVKPIPDSLTPSQEKRVREALGPGVDYTIEDLEQLLVEARKGVREIEAKILRKWGMPKPDDTDDE